MGLAPHNQNDVRPRGNEASLRTGTARKPAPPVLNAFTVDVEDYFQVSAFESGIERANWDDYESRVTENTGRILDLLGRHDIRGTFFVLGWVASKHPELVQRITAAGHEVASHGYWHQLVYRQTPDEFRADLVRSRDVLQDITGQPVTAYRAPSFSIVTRSLWALDVLVEEGFRVDSSIFPVRHDRYGVPDARREIHVRETAAGPICEFPPSVLRVAPMNVPISGGGYFRLFPLAFMIRSWRRLVHRRMPGMFYIHPWELDPEQPRLRVAGRVSRFRHYVNLARTADKLDRFVSRFAFAPIGDVLAQQNFAEFSRPLVSQS